MNKNRGTSQNQILFIEGSKAWESGNPWEAFELFLRAARANDESSQLNVGYFYDKGIGVKKDKEEALRWYRKAYSYACIADSICFMKQVKTFHRPFGEFLLNQKCSVLRMRQVVTHDERCKKIPGSSL